jgi:hypothetical protein
MPTIKPGRKPTKQGYTADRHSLIDRFYGRSRPGRNLYHNPYLMLV